MTFSGSAHAVGVSSCTFPVMPRPLTHFPPPPLSAPSSCLLSQFPPSPHGHSFFALCCLLSLFVSTFSCPRATAACPVLILESLGILTRRDLELYCTPSGPSSSAIRLWRPGHPRPRPAPSAHGLGWRLGLCLRSHQGVTVASTSCCPRHQGTPPGKRKPRPILRGFTWEGDASGGQPKVDNLVAFVDLHDRVRSRMSETHPAFIPAHKLTPSAGGPPRSTVTTPLVDPRDPSLRLRGGLRSCSSGGP